MSAPVEMLRWEVHDVEVVVTIEPGATSYYVHGYLDSSSPRELLSTLPDRLGCFRYSYRGARIAAVRIAKRLKRRVERRERRRAKLHA